MPPYFKEFFKLYLEAQGKENKQEIPWEDRLAALYYAYAMKNANKFVSDWFCLNLNINNMLTAITCRKHGFDKAGYIVGDNEVAQALRTSNARDFGLGDTVDYLPDLWRIAEETDLMVREKKVDLLKWEWLEEHTFFKPFDIESVFAYLLKLEMIERWVMLDKATGEKTFREIIPADFVSPSFRQQSNMASLIVISCTSAKVFSNWYKALYISFIAQIDSIFLYVVDGDKDI